MATVIKPKRSETASSVPTTGNLAVGEMAVNTADQKIYVRDSADNIVVVADSSTATSAKNMFFFTATASQTTFSGTDDDGNTLSYSVGTGKTNIYLNGILLDDSDYTATNGTSVVLSSGAAADDILTVEAFTISSIFELSDDASPQLGGNLDLNSNDITGTGNLNFTGNITLTGTVDGRDIATDGTKLDGIEASADVTDTANVTAAGALMDSEVTNLAQVKAFSSADYATAAQGTTADSALQDVVDDTTPQLGGNLDVNGNKIVSTSNGNIDIEPNGTGNVLLGNLTFDADQTVGAGQDNYVLTYDNSSGVISLEAAAGGGGLSDVVDDTTPQLGGDLDLNSSDITGTGNIDITGTIATSGGVDVLQNQWSNVTGNMTGFVNDGGGNLGIRFNATSGGTNTLVENGTAWEFQASNDSSTGDFTFYAAETSSGTAGDTITWRTLMNFEGSDRSVRLHYDSSEKLATTSTGIDVTGTVTADGLTVDTDTLHVDATNNRVGIGTTSPSVKFHLSEASTDFTALITNSTASGNGVKIQAGDNSGDRILQLDDKDGNERMRVTADGNVGIGTTSPSETLDVNGVVALSASTTEDRNIEIGKGRTGNGYAYIDLIGDATYSDYGLRLLRANNGANANSQLVHRGTGALQIRTTEAANIDFYTSNAFDFRMTSSGDFHADGDVIAYSTTTSDVRLKSDVEPITDALSKVNQLSGYTFTRKHNGQKSAGILAHELEKVLPEAVREKELPLQQDDGEMYKVVEYDAIHGLLIEAIKELSDKVERLEERLQIEDGLGNK